MATRMQQRRGTAAQWTSANPVLGAGEIGFETDTGKFKFGDGVNEWGDLAYFLDATDLDLGASLDDYVPLTQKGANNGVATLDGTGKVPLAQLGNIIDGAPETLNTLNELAAALSDDANYATTVQNLIEARAKWTIKTAAQWASEDPTVLPGSISIESDTGKIKIAKASVPYSQLDYLPLKTDVDGSITAIESDITDLQTAVTNLETFESSAEGDIDALEGRATTLEGQVSTLEGQVSTLESSMTSAEGDITTLQGDVSDLQGDVALLAPKDSPSFTGNVSLPSTTTIGNLSSTEIGYLATVTSDVQTQLNAKLDSGTASSTYAPLAGPSFTGTVVLPSTTSIGDVSATEIGYLNNVTSAIQTQLDAKAPTASPTFTGTVSGITATMVGLGNVDNTSDANKPVSTATQTALDGKLSLSGGTMTGNIVLAGAPTQALHPATKAYADSIAEGLHIHPSCVAATTANIDISNALENGDVLDGVTLVTGDRVLVKNQTTTSQNGIYVVQASGAAVRATDFDAPAEVDGGDFVFVTGGTVNNDTGWVQTSTGMTTIGTDPITFTQFSGAGTITAGTNISVSGNQVSTVNNPTFSGLITASSGVAFSDGTQTLEGVPSRTPIVQQTAAYNLSTGGLSLRDSLIEISHTGGSAVNLTIPADSTTNFPVGTSIDVVRTNTGGVTIVGAGGVTVNGTPGLTLRAQWSSATLFKRAANTWLVMGDLTA